MKQNISALMDGELFEDEIAGSFAHLKQGSEAHKNWELYHLIGDVLRQPDHVTPDLSSAVSLLLKEEPTVFAPRGHRIHVQNRNFALSAAATVAAIGVVAWMALQTSSEISPRMASQSLGLRPANVQIKSNSNEYLMAHQEFSPSTDMNGGASYIRTVAFNPDEK
jgi:sigma-E factor negative regulatory protein RseA